MSTEREATPPPHRIWIDWRERDAQRGAGSYYFCGREGFSTEYIRSDSFDTMRDALEQIAVGETSADRDPVSTVRRLRQIASSALAAIEGKDS